MSSDAFGFARTKVQPPRLRAGLLARPALAARVAAGLRQQRLTLVSAPGGYGKSSALVQALADGGIAHAWVACDADDTLPRLAAAIAAALDPFDLPWRQAPESLIATIDRPDGARAFRDALVNALAATEVARAVLVLDDLHRLSHDGQHEGLHELLAPLAWALPPNWGLAVSTRVDPPWPLARLRAAGELAELRQDDLRFGADEVQALAGADAPALLARTEGWPVGVTLALGGARTAQPVRSERHAVDYLRSEVLDALPPELRDFLVRRLGAARAHGRARRGHDRPCRRGALARRDRAPRPCSTRRWTAPSARCACTTSSAPRSRPSGACCRCPTSARCGGARPTPSRTRRAASTACCRPASPPPRPTRCAPWRPRWWPPPAGRTWSR
ncbi:MAG: hypothetical protein U1F53_08345 [Burkholderiaceae bacterium]